MSFRQGADGAYTRGHQKNLSSFGGGFSVLPPLSIPDTMVLHGRFLQQGLLDASKFEAVIQTLATNKVTQANTFKSSILQGVVLVSAVAIKPLLQSVIPDDHSGQMTTTSGIAYVLFHLFWLYPLSIAATYYSGLLRSQEAEGRRGASRVEYRGITAKIVAESYKALLLANYLLVVHLLSWVPWIGAPISFLYACMVDSYYCYESTWLKSGWGLSERVKHLEERWGYFLGFGFPITFLSWWSSDPVVNLAIFSLFFPLFQIMSATSIPQPLDPKLPISSLAISFLPAAAGSFSMAAAEGGEEARGRRGNPLVPIRIHVLFLADKAHGFLMANFASKKKDAGGNTNGGGYGAAQAYGAYGAPAQPGYPDAGGWRGDYGAPTGMAGAPPPQPYQQPVGATGYGGGYGSHAGTGAGFVQSPPRRGHVMTESSVGVGMGAPDAHGGEFADKRLDSLISAAGRRKKGE